MCKAIGAIIAIIALSTMLLAQHRVIYVYVTAATEQGIQNAGTADSVKDLKAFLMKGSPFFFVCEDPENADINVLIKSRDVKTEISKVTGKSEVQNVIQAQVEFETEKTDIEGGCTVAQGWPCATMALTGNLNDWAVANRHRVMDLRDKE